jgi:hypothetical protein
MRGKTFFRVIASLLNFTMPTGVASNRRPLARSLKDWWG